ncbi:MAG TPA: hypothetical protein P5531_14150 [Bacteroidales bacterium]|nr:hypothetical protein [Bacteroidales bacterium]HSA44710.1 hypothetical protein [Bacteroidales bacterium]
MKKFLLFIHQVMPLLLITALVFTLSCKKDETGPDDPAPVTHPRVYVCNEGPFMNGSGSISVFDKVTGTVVNHLFYKVNGFHLGNIVQSMEVVDETGYIIVNNANKIEVVRMSDFSSLGMIENLTLPRFFLQIDAKKAYVSCWDNTVAVLSLLTNNVEKHAATGTGPERMVKIDNRVFVLNQGGFGIDSTITVMDAGSDLAIHSLQVYPKPTGAVADAEGKLWVLCSGKGFNGWPQADDSKGHLLRIDPLSYQVLADYEFPATDKHPDKLVINQAGNAMFYIYESGIYRFRPGDTALPGTPLISHAGYIYALGYDDQDDMLYFSDPVDFVQNGWIFRHKASDGLAVDSFLTGVIPTYFTFR